MCNTRLRSDSLLSVTSCNGWHLSLAFLFFFFFLPCYLPIIFGSSDIPHLLLQPPPHLMVYSPNVSWPDPEMAFLFARIWSFLLCLTQNITPSQTKHVVFFPPSLFMRLFVCFPNAVCQRWDVLMRLVTLTLEKKYDPPVPQWENFNILKGTLTWEMRTSNVTFTK